MLEYFRKIFNKSDEEKVEIEFTGTIDFILRVEDLVIGHLNYNDGLWKFRYAEEFKSQESYRRLTGFSDLNKEYESSILWPFFKIRIPGLKQPRILEILEKENIDKRNEAILLQRFGRVTLSNPYILEPKV